MDSLPEAAEHHAIDPSPRVGCGSESGRDTRTSNAGEHGSVRAGFRGWLDRRACLLLAVYWLVLIVATHWPRLDVTGGHNELAGGIFQVDKLLHVAGFGLLAWLLLKARPAGRRASNRLTAAVALLIAIGYAFLNEFTQQWFERQISSSDVIASTIGITSVVILWLTPQMAVVSGPRTWRIIFTRLIWIIAAPLLTVLTILPQGNSIVGHVVAYIDLPQTGLDKQLHFTFTMVLTWLLVAGAPMGRRRPRSGALLTILVMAASAPLIEVVQLHTGRDFEVADVVAGESGLLAGLAVWVIVLLAWAWMNKEPKSQRAKERGDGAAARQPLNVPTRASHGFVGHAVLVSGLTLVSRMTGLIRDAVLAAAFGLGPIADAFFIGFLVPNLFRRLFGEGALSAAFIPHYAELLKRDTNLARRFATVCLTFLTVLLTGLTVLGEVALWAAIHYAHWSPSTSLALRLTMVMLPYMPLICLVALIGGILQVHKRFGPPAAAPLVLNLVMIGAALWATWGQGTGGAGAFPMRHTAMVVAWGVVLAGMLQLIWQGTMLLRETKLSLVRESAWGELWPSLRSMLVMMGPMVVGLAVFQINTFLDSMIAFGLSGPAPSSLRSSGAVLGNAQLHIFGWSAAYPMQDGAVAALQWAQRLYQFPLGVFGIAIATAIFPALAAAVGEEGEAATVGGRKGVSPSEGFMAILRQGLRLTVFIGLPASVGLILLSLPLVRVVYERGAFSADDAQRVATILVGYAAAVWAYSMTHVITRGFYALKDSTTPLKISVLMVAFNLVLNLILIWPLGAAGLAWSTAASAVGQVALLLLALRRRTATPINRDVLRGWGRTLGLTAVMAAVIWPLVAMLDLAHRPLWPAAGLVLGMVALGALIVLGGGWLTGAEELRWLLRRGRS